MLAINQIEIRHLLIKTIIKTISDCLTVRVAYSENHLNSVVR